VLKLNAWVESISYDLTFIKLVCSAYEPSFFNEEKTTTYSSLKEIINLCPVFKENIPEIKEEFYQLQMSEYKFQRSILSRIFNGLLGYRLDGLILLDDDETRDYGITFNNQRHLISTSSGISLKVSSDLLSSTKSDDNKIRTFREKGFLSLVNSKYLTDDLSSYFRDTLIGRERKESVMTQIPLSKSIGDTLFLNNEQGKSLITKRIINKRTINAPYEINYEFINL
jgi:hypothetical protein